MENIFAKKDMPLGSALATQRRAPFLCLQEKAFAPCSLVGVALVPAGVQPCKNGRVKSSRKVPR